MNLHEKIVEVRKEIDFFTRDKKGYNYSYVSGSQVLAKIKNKMDSLGLILEPTVDYSLSKYEIFQYDTTDKYNKTKHNIDYIVSGPMAYTWINAEKPEERSVCSWCYFGQQDEISKAFGSALTYSERYFLMKYFNIPTDDLDPDLKQKLTEDATPVTKVKEKAKAHVSKGEEVISVQQAKNLLILSGNDKDLCLEVVKSFGYNGACEVMQKDYDNIYVAIQNAAVTKNREPKIVINQ